MKTLGARTLKKQPTTSSPGQTHKPQMMPIMKHLAVPRNDNTLYGSDNTMQLSTRNQTCSARSSDLGSISASNHNSQESVGLSHSALNQEQDVEEVDALPLLQMAPRELMEFRWLKTLQSGLPEVDLEDV